MEITVRPIQKSDYPAAAAIWRDVLDIINATDESVAETYEQMARDENYATFVARAQGRVVGLVTAVKVLAVGHPGGYVKMNGLGVIGEYVGKIFLETKRRPRYIVSERTDGAPGAGVKEEKAQR